MIADLAIVLLLRANLAASAAILIVLLLRLQRGGCWGPKWRMACGCWSLWRR